MTQSALNHVPADRKAFVYLDFCFYAYCNFTRTYCRESNEHMSKGAGRAAFDQTIADFLAHNSAAVLKLLGYSETTLTRARDRLIAPLGPVAAVGTDPDIDRRQLQYLHDGNVGAKCSTRFTHYDLINLYLDGFIPDEEISCVPSLSSPGALAHLRTVKADMAPYLYQRELNADA